MEQIKVENFLELVDFEKHGGLIPAIIQDDITKEVLMVGFMNKEALEKTLKEGRVTYFSRTKERLWTKGETSGNFQVVQNIFLDCDNDSLLILIEQKGSVCHTGKNTCFFKHVNL
ncbi:hypothetical protein A3A21_01200 [Candidatus Jorgensenbacteria bacterium RIFCSPLOWO2_01_FULL_45_25b]|uniref:Phosphoribosyl-AMP cyclohydrolase n=1 Tax=Candidatus Jorgensenbacteria bacterium RIFCSPLOWO2_01_FULL_45_25b TaxID=1798471 RepID=A0A1F6BT96_9BACT|nr:MAG: hypothetical protein A3A21_01200 [Candidatus Jorgensenbacteria bacterium RIFCSPLOWO2_01_FULL_45_25b]